MLQKLCKRLGLNLWTLDQRVTYNQLARMNDRELRDIGINRSDIWRIVEDMGAVK